MTRKTGKTAVKARQLVRSAKLAKYKRDLHDAGVSLNLPKPSNTAMKEKEEELKKLYRELFPEEAKKKEEGAEKPVDEEAEEQPDKETPEENPDQDDSEEGSCG